MKQSLAARFLFRVVVLAFLVYAMLLTWWTPFTGDSLMHSVFGADHRLAFQPVLERCWWSYMHWNPRLGEFLAIFTATAGKWLFLAVIVDFKTDHAESPEQLRKRHSNQLNAYTRIVSRITGIPLERITRIIVSTCLKETVPIQ